MASPHRRCILQQWMGVQRGGGGDEALGYVIVGHGDNDEGEVVRCGGEQCR